MNAKQKGSGFELEVRKYLESQGWAVFRVHRKPLFINKRMVTIGADIFGCDIVAKRAGQKTRYIQVSVDGRKAEKEAQIREHPLSPEFEDLEIWLRIRGQKAFRVWKAEAGEGALTGHAIVFNEQASLKVAI